jgi:hypothetical protein
MTLIVITAHLTSLETMSCQFICDCHLRPQEYTFDWGLLNNYANLYHASNSSSYLNLKQMSTWKRWPTPSHRCPCHIINFLSLSFTIIHLLCLMCWEKYLHLTYKTQHWGLGSKTSCNKSNKC